MNIHLRGKVLAVRFEDDPYFEGRAVDGLVDHNETPCPCLILRRGLSSLDLYDTVIHEMCHFFFPDVSEDVVLMFGNEVSKALSTLGLLHDPREEGKQTFLQ